MQTISEDQVLDGRTVLVVKPEGEGPWPGVVMLHEIFGLDEVMRRLAARVAAMGYLVLAPDLLGQGPWLRCVRSAFTAFSAREGKPFELIEACRQQLLVRPDCTGKVGAIGFCFGGGFALLLAADGYQAVSVNYGMIPDDIDAIAAKAGPIVASYGGRDRMARDVPKLETALAAHEVPHDVKVYPPAGHCFLNDAPVGPLPMRVLTRPLKLASGVGPEPGSAEDAWGRIESFFAVHLRTGA